MDEVKVYVEAQINPTESEEKVRRAVENVFGNIQTKTQPTHKGSLLIAEAEGLEALTKLYNLLRRERIRDAARGALFNGLSGKTISFCLNKQAAYAGHVSFSEEVSESPLGPLKVKIECDNPRGLIDWLAPKTA
ncbi:MAG: RNA-binding domain-containing protein [Candidatus Bathycorpusculaceae bacterium]